MNRNQLQTRANAPRPSVRKPAHKKRPSRSRTLIISVVAVVVVVFAAVNMTRVFSGQSGNGDDSGETGLPFVSEQTQNEPDNIVITLGGSKDTYVLKGEEYLEAGAHAVETGMGDITDSVIIEGAVDTTKTGDYEVSYTAENSSGQQLKKVRTVHVVDEFEEPAKSIPVLMYHYVYTENDVPEKMNNNYLLDTKLVKHCEYLRDNDYYYPSYQELAAFVEGTHTLPAKSVILTFDDGERGFLEYGIPILNEYEVPATSFVICSDPEASAKLLNHASEYVQFQSHTFNMHRDGTNIGQGGIIHVLSKDEILEDVLKSQEILGGKINALAYPYGDNNQTAWAALDEAGVTCAFTVKNDRVRPGDNRLALNRVRIASEYSFEGFKALVAPNGVA